MILGVKVLIRKHMLRSSKRQDAAALKFSNNCGYPYEELSLCPLSFFIFTFYFIDFEQFLAFSFAIISNSSFVTTLPSSDFLNQLLAKLIHFEEMLDISV
jgi:hypothetical protein